MAEGREWTRQRLQQRLQEEANHYGGVFPPQWKGANHRRSRPMQMRTQAGVVELTVSYGQDPQDGHWGCPMRELWGLSAHQQLSLALEDKLAFTVTATGSYEEAAAVARKWGSVGAKAETQTQERLETLPSERQPQRSASPLGVLMVDVWQVRQRGNGWGKKQTQKPRVEWHELKTGVFYRHEQSAQTSGGRGLLEDKIVVSWQVESGELGRRLRWEALHNGLGRALEVLFLGGGGGVTGLLSWRPASVGLGRGLSWSGTLAIVPMG